MLKRPLLAICAGCAAILCVPFLAPAGVGDAGLKGAAFDGVRYGQAAGAALVCYGLKTTPLVASLRGKYQGADLANFDTQAAKVLDAWKATQTCKNAGGPNPCKLSHIWSCQEALKEIGPDGTIVQGLVAPKE